MFLKDILYDIYSVGQVRGVTSPSLSRTHNDIISGYIMFAILLKFKYTIDIA